MMLAATVAAAAMRNARAAAWSTPEEMVLVAHFIIGSIIILYIMGLTGVRETIGGKGFTGAYLINLFGGRAKVVRGVLDTGPNAIMITEGPPCRLSVIERTHFTVTYWLLRKSPSVRPVRPLEMHNRLSVEILPMRSLRRRPSRMQLPWIIALVSRMYIVAKGGASAASKIPVPTGLRKLATWPSSVAVAAGWPVGARATLLIRGCG